MGILKSIFGDKKLIDLDSKIDNLINAIPPKKESLQNTEEITSKIIDKVVVSNDNTDNFEISKLFQDVAVPQDRINRYNAYEEVYKAVPIIRTIIKTYLSNLLPKNPVDSKSYVFREISNHENNNSEVTVEKARKFSEDVLEHYNLIKKCKELILPKRLVYGDCFVEIIDLKSEMNKVDLSKSASSQVLNENNNLTLDNVLPYLLEIEVPKEINSQLLYESSISQSEEKELNNQSYDDMSKNIKIDFEDVLIRVHKPHNIVILETKYGTRLGYLEIIKKDPNDNITQNITQVVSKLVSTNKKDTNIQEKTVNKLLIYVLNQIVNIAKQNSKSDSKKLDVNELVSSLGDDVFLFMKRMFVEQGLYKNDKFNALKVRFIPVNRMVQFSTPSADYSPYGESVIESLILPARLYMLSQLANIITKLSRASIQRVWKLDVGSTQQHSQMIQKFERQLYNSRISLGDLTSLKSIPKILSDYKDLITLTKNGTEQLSVDVQPLGDSSIKVADLEDSRRELIALSRIPAQFLGYADGIEMREQLVHSNITFATEIIDQQESDNIGLNKVIDIIAEIKQVNFKPSSLNHVHFIPPAVLMLQLIEMTINSIGTISGIFGQIGINADPFFFLEQYIPQINWDKFKKSSEKRDLENRSKAQMNMADPSNQSQSGSGGMPGM